MNTKDLLKNVRRYHRLTDELAEIKAWLLMNLPEKVEVLGLEKVISSRIYYSAADKKWLSENYTPGQWARHAADPKRIARLLEKDAIAAQYFEDGHHEKTSESLRTVKNDD